VHPGGGLSAPGALHRAHTDPGWSAARHQDVPHTIELDILEGRQRPGNITCW